MNIDEFQRRVDQYFGRGERNEPAGRLILDLWRALRHATPSAETLAHFEKRVEQHTGPLDQRTKDTALVWDLWSALKELRVPDGIGHREPALGPLGMGSAEGIKNQANEFQIWKTMHDGLRAKYPDLPDLTPIMQRAYDEPPTVREVTSLEQAKKEFGPDQPAPEWLIGAVDRLRDDYKDGNYYRSKAAAEELLTAIDAAGYAIVHKEQRVAIANAMFSLESSDTANAALRAENETLRAKMRRIGELNAENLADIDALLARRRRRWRWRP